VRESFGLRPERINPSVLSETTETDEIILEARNTLNRRCPQITVNYFKRSIG
jgi:hypothetical protein